MKRISIDMDGVIANIYTQFIKMHAAEFGKVILPEEYNGRPEVAVFPKEWEYVNSPGFFRNAPVMQDSQRVLKRLNERYKIFIVSAAMEFPNSLVEKLDWMKEHFPFITWQQMVFCGSKEIIRADLMIDDHFKNLDFFTGETILFTQPHNIYSPDGKHKRVDNWPQIEEMLLF